MKTKSNLGYVSAILEPNHHPYTASFSVSRRNGAKSWKVSRCVQIHYNFFIELRLLAEAKKQIATGLRRQTEGRDRKQLNIRIRGLIREVPGFCPEGAWTTYTLAQECHLTSKKNLVCVYHSVNRGPNQHISDGDVNARWEIMGQPFPYAVNTDEVKEPIVDGYWHCGCLEADVLLDFFLSKSLLLERYVELACKVDNEGIMQVVGGRKVVEGLGTDHLTPRQRTFVCQLYRDLTGEDYMDVYLWNRSPEQHRRRQLMLRMGRMLEELNETAGPGYALYAMEPPLDVNDPLLAYDPDDFRSGSL